MELYRVGRFVGEVEVKDLELGGVGEVGVEGSSNCSGGEERSMLAWAPGKGRGS